MKRLIGAVIIIFGMMSPLWGADTVGTLSAYVFYQGAAQPSNEMLVDGQKSYFTDKDGSIKVELSAGSHQIEIFAKNKKGEHLGYSKKHVVIKEGKDTQLIATFEGGEKSTVLVEVPDESKAASVTKIDTTKLGTLKGMVLSEDKRLPIANARIFVKGTSIDARSDAKGNFSFLIPAEQNISISVVHSEHSSQTFNNIVVAKNGAIEQKVLLTPAGVELEEFVVLAPKVSGTITAVMLEEKESKAITNIISSEEMSKKGDSDAATALKRVTGVTLIGGKSIYVRGLGDRYSNVELNSLPLPSPDPTKRVVPLDIFPAGVIGSMKVQKSATPDIPSSFGGGYVDIRTKEKADENYFKVSIEAKVNSNTGKTVDSYQGSNKDWSGFDDGYREIPKTITDATKVVVGERTNTLNTNDFTREQLAQFTQDYVPRNYDVTQKSLPAGFKGGIEGAYNFEIANKHNMSIFGNYMYEQDHKFREEKYAKYDYDDAAGQLYDTAVQDGTVRNTTSKYSHAGLINVGYDFDDVFKLKYTKLYSHTALDTTRITTENYYNGSDEDLTRYNLYWEERTLDVNQINGMFDYELYDHPSTLTFGMELATSKLYQPNNYSYAYETANDPYTGVPYLESQEERSSHSNSLQSDDDVSAFYITNRLNYDVFTPEDYLEVGVASSKKERESRQDKYYLKRLQARTVPDSVMTGSIESIYDKYVRPDIPYEDRLLIISGDSDPGDYFDAEVNEQSIYMSAFVNPHKAIEVLAGFRYVNFEQDLYQYVPDRTDNLIVKKVPETLEMSDIYPSISIKYKMDEKNQIDTAVSKTYIVPDLREFSGGTYSHPYEVADIIGNPNLENTTIYNYDLKYSHFFSDSENIKFGLFYKLLDKPIEDISVASSGITIYSFANADSATLYGFEVDGRKELNFITSYLDSCFVSGNFSYTDSDVTLQKEQEALFTSKHRQLQGLSQRVLNISLGYEVAHRSATLSYNQMSERIRTVGTLDFQDTTMDTYEFPPSVLDFVWMEKLTPSLSGQLKLQNILDEETIWKQGDNITNRFRLGQNFSFGLTYKY